MIIDVRKAKTEEFGRPFTLRSAVAMAVEPLKVGQSILIEKTLDAVGREVQPTRLPGVIATVRGSRRFSTRSREEGVMITRIS